MAAFVTLFLLSLQVRFDQDLIISELNEYEILQLLMGDCREKLSAYEGNVEEEVKSLQLQEMSPQERLAARLRLAEKRILTSMMDAVRRWAEVVVVLLRS